MYRSLLHIYTYIRKQKGELSSGGPHPIFGKNKNKNKTRAPPRSVRLVGKNKNKMRQLQYFFYRLSVSKKKKVS